MNHATDGNLSDIDAFLNALEEKDAWNGMTDEEQQQYFMYNMDEPDHERSD
jgi:hypothetical protein